MKLTCLLCLSLYIACVPGPVLAAPAEKGRPPLINVKSLAPSLLVEMRYASSNNFTQTVLYDAAECLLVEPAARRLARVQHTLEKSGLGLKIWDCYRPLSVQKKLWALVPDSRYVANPAKGSKHNRGASVDLTLIDRNGHELPMPTAFDEFSPRAHRDFMDLPEEAIQNRARLEKAMEAEGFVGLPTEWWHFDEPRWMKYALRDEPLSAASLETDIESLEAPVTIPPSVRQLVMVISDRWPDRTGELSRWIKNGDAWMEDGTAVPVSLGPRGQAWGRGLHTLDWNGPVKKEGDLKTPAGLFRIGGSYGPAASPPKGQRWPYQPVDQKWFCVDDSRSVNYNRVLALDEGEKKDWKSAETMLRRDGLYKWVINIEQNYPDVKPGSGSCIFFHVWRRPGAPTEGCIAMEEKSIVDLLNWLDPEADPHTVILPRDVYNNLESTWRLPPLEFGSPP